MLEHLYKFCVTLALLCACDTVLAKIPGSERAVLDALYAQTNGASWTNSAGWEIQATDECYWYGVYCDPSGMHVQQLLLNKNNLAGTLPQIINLPGLQVFWARNNNLTGTIPSLTGLTNLQDIDLGFNKLSGAIPSLGGLDNLRHFYVSYNQLTGAIPPLAGLPELVDFFTTSNQLSGVIPSLAGLINLQYFEIDGNRCTGEIPPLTGLASLRGFSASFNLLTGRIPSLAGLVNLQYVELRDNQLTGLPSLTGLPNLFYFEAEENQLTGTVPAFSALPNLQWFIVSNNKLSGPIPSLSALKSIESIAFGGNQFTGSIPALSGLSNLQDIEFENNRLTGQIPSLADVTQLGYFKADHNQLTGAIPALTGLTHLGYFGVDHNQLTGSLPSLAGLSNLQNFLVGNNLLSGAVPVTPAPPNKLVAGQSSLCPNNLTTSTDAAWDTATGAMPWWNSCANPPGTDVRISAGPHGSIPPDNVRYVTYGATMSFVVTPDPGYTTRIDSDCGGTLSGAIFTSGPIVDWCDITVTFVPVDYVPLNPVRLMDTRIGAKFMTIDGTSAGAGAIPAGAVRTLQITARGTIPGTLTSAVALNVTPVNPTDVGYVTVWSGSGGPPLAANLNLSPGKTIPNLVISQVDGSGQVSIYNGGVAAVDVVVDAQGYFPTSTSYVSMTPARLLDTRPGQHTVDGSDAAIGAVSSASQLDLPVLTRASIPDSGVDTLIFNLTAVLPSNVGYVTAWSGDDALPTAANLNLNPGYTTPNLVFSKVGAQGAVSIYNGGLAGTNLVADVQGWFPTGSSYTALTPARLVDTRPGRGTIDDTNAGEGALAAGGQLDVQVTARGGVPASGVGAVVLNVTAVNPTDVGYLTVWPSGAGRPSTANLNLNPGLTLPNLVIAKVGSDGKVSIYSGGLGPTHIVVDVQGWFAAAP